MKKIFFKNSNIKGISGSELMLFLFFVLVSCCLWLMMTLNRDYETDIKFNVSVKEIPDEVAFSLHNEKLVVRVRDRGTTLMNYQLGTFLPISVSYSELINKKGRLLLPAQVVSKRVKKQLQSTTELLSIAPDTIVYYTRESAVKCPVVPDIAVTPAPQYAIGNITVVPDTVRVFAPAYVADTLTVVATELLEKSDVRDTLIVKLSLKSVENATCNPEEVTVTIPVYPFTQKIMELPVTAVDFPDGYKLRTFPSHVQLRLNVGLDNYDLATANDFEVGISYLDIDDNEGGGAPLKLLRAPHWAKDFKIVPSTVEFIIERQ